MAFAARSLKRKNHKGLALNATEPRHTTPSIADSQIQGATRRLEDSEPQLEIGLEFRLDLHNEDLKVIKELGAGNGGTVSKVQHVATQAIMARKVCLNDARRQRRMLSTSTDHTCGSQARSTEANRERTWNYARVQFPLYRLLLWGFHERLWGCGDVYGVHGLRVGHHVLVICILDALLTILCLYSSLDSISRNFGPIRVDVLGKIAEAVLAGLTYLYSAHKIMHRDIKPSNILVNSRGQIKLCDFGVSSELVNSVADTFVGTGTYMAPERIQGSAYTVKSDVWSVGLTLMELAIGRFPFGSDNDMNGEDSGGPQGILDLLQQIVLEPAPKLPKSDAFPQIMEDMIARCLMKAPEQRPTPLELYVSWHTINRERRLTSFSSGI